MLCIYRTQILILTKNFTTPNFYEKFDMCEKKNSSYIYKLFKLVKKFNYFVLIKSLQLIN